MPKFWLAESGESRRLTSLAVHLVGLTGGIGAGKSTVADAFVARGAVLVDADRIAREVVAPGGAAYEPLRARFGPAVFDAAGNLDRAALAAVVFKDPDALADLNGITHPAIGATMATQAAEHAATDRIVVLDIPLLRAETRGQWDFETVVVVDAPPDVAVERLVSLRSMPRDDAEARIAAQISREERVAIADVVIDNRGDRAALGAEIDRAWEEIQRRAKAQ